MHILCAEKYGNMQLQFAYISLLVAFRLLVCFCLFYTFLSTLLLFISLYFCCFLIFRIWEYWLQPPNPTSLRYQRTCNTGSFQEQILSLNL